MAAWKVCRDQIVSSLLPFTDFSYADDFGVSTIEDTDDFKENNDLSCFPLSYQEQLLVGDLIHSYAGLQGDNIHFHYDEDMVKWMVNPSGDQSLRSALYASGCLPLAGILIRLRFFIRLLSCNLSRGRIAQAVAGVADEFLNSDVMPVIIQMEQTSKNEQRSVLISKMGIRMRTFGAVAKSAVDTLSRIVNDNLVGGEIITFVYKQVQVCAAPTVRALLYRMERAALHQYYNLIFEWIHFGRLTSDVTHEFMVWDLKKTNKFSRKEVIGDDNSQREEEYNEFYQRFCVIPSLCPIELISVADDIVLCGKYLNILETLKGREAVVYNDDDGAWKENDLEDWKEMEVEDVILVAKRARTEASQNLVAVLRKEYGLDDLFRTFGHFFLLRCCDWLETLVDVADGLLSEKPQGGTISKIQSLFEEVVECSAVSDQRFKANFKIIYDKNDVFTFIRCIALKGKSQLVSSDPRWYENITPLIADGLSLQVSFESPLSMVFTSDFIYVYTMFFRILFTLHRTVHLINTKLLYTDLMMEERSLLSEMLKVITAYLGHCSERVIGSEWKNFLTRLKKAVSVEEIISNQRSFFSTVDSQCLLTDSGFVDALQNVLMTVTSFTLNDLPFENAQTTWKNAVKLLEEVVFITDAQFNVGSKIFSRIF